MAYIVSTASLVGWEPSLNDPRWQSLVAPTGLAIRDIVPNDNCQINVNRRELVVPHGQTCILDIKQATNNAGTRAFSLRLSQGLLEGNVVLRLLFDGKPLTIEQQIAPLQSGSFELYEEGGQLFVPVCENEGMPCVLKVTNDSS